MYWLLWLVFASPVTLPVDEQVLSSTLSSIERKANLVQQHPDAATPEAQSAARAAGQLAPEIEAVAPGLVRTVDEMADAARQGNRTAETRQKALEVMERVRAARATEE